MIFHIFASFISCAYYNQHEEKSFLSWMRSTNQFYTGDEYKLRFGIFIANSRFVKEFNSAHKFKVSLNKFAACTPAEYKAHFGLHLARTKRIQPKFSKKTTADSVDWRDKGVVNEIKDQGQCQSNYAFSLIQSMESIDAIKTGTLQSFSEQNIIDCSYMTYGCNGGNPVFAYEYILEDQNGQVYLEKDYVYTGYDQDCQLSKYQPYGTFTDFIMIDEDDEDDLAAKIENYGPASVCVDASKASFQLYSTGIYDEPSCSLDDINHALGCVGFGSEGDVRYWIVRNQWGKSWGESGYIRMIRENNQCGIATMAFIAQ